jgi:hypothetical protein
MAVIIWLTLPLEGVRGVIFGSVWIIISLLIMIACLHNDTTPKENFWGKFWGVSIVTIMGPWAVMTVGIAVTLDHIENMINKRTNS